MQTSLSWIALVFAIALTVWFIWKFSIAWFIWEFLFFSSFCCSKKGKEKKEVSEIELEKKQSGYVKFDSEDYEVDKNDKNLFHSLRIPDLSIRLVSKSNNKDLIFLSTSWPHNFTFSNLDVISNRVPEIIKKEVRDVSELELVKSPASELVNIKDRLLKAVFGYLFREYAWQFEKQQVIINYCNFNGCDDTLTISMKLEVKRHVRLFACLTNIEGLYIDGQEQNSLVSPKVYVIKLGLARQFDWHETLPKIKNILEEYFVGGVDIVCL